MKTIILTMAFLFSLTSFALTQAGYVKNIIEDDEGVKVVLTGVLEVANAQNVKTVHIPNTTSNFEEIRQLLSESKSVGAPVLIMLNADKSVAVKKAGK